MMKPYYDEDGITIYHGDCREILASLKFDVVVTDPPYGISLDTDYSKLRGSTRQYAQICGDSEPFDPEPLLKYQCCLFGANHFASKLPPNGTWHVWDKRETAKPNIFADFEMYWTSFPTGPSRIFRYQWVCGVHPGAPNEIVGHPTVKPLKLMMAVVDQMPDGVIIDPFMGSGTTLVAAKKLGRKAIGIEIEEKYCEIAVQRLAQKVLDFSAA